ncbi:hypothetical protein MMC07_005744 [Pseudocyphellaria aurata]|nr:hypothetical protein [Pseudocyphellaria aurata]
MAADTREDSSQQSTSARPPSSSSIRDDSQEKLSAAPENANALPGGAINTAGGKVRKLTIMEALKTIQLQDFNDFYKKPCARDALLAGIGAGFGIGGLRGIMGVPALKACSWAVGTFCFGSFVVHEFCQRKRQLEIQGLKRAVQVIDRKKAERQESVDRTEMTNQRTEAGVESAKN